MNQKTYYLYAMTTPLWLPLVGYPLWRFPLLSELVELLFYSLIYGGIPYLIFFIGVLVWSQNQNGAGLQRAIVFFPPFFALFLPVSLFIFFTTLEGPLGGLHDVWEFLSLFALYALVFGYAYVGLAGVGCMLLKRCGIITSNPEPL